MPVIGNIGGACLGGTIIFMGYSSGRFRKVVKRLREFSARMVNDCCFIEYSEALEAVLFKFDNL